MSEESERVQAKKRHGTPHTHTHHAHSVTESRRCKPQNGVTFVGVIELGKVNRHGQSVVACYLQLGQELDQDAFLERCDTHTQKHRESERERSKRWIGNNAAMHDKHAANVPC